MDYLQPFDRLRASLECFVPNLAAANQADSRCFATFVASGLWKVESKVEKAFILAAVPWLVSSLSFKLPSQLSQGHTLESFGRVLLRTAGLEAGEIHLFTVPVAYYETSLSDQTPSVRVSGQW